MATTMTKKDAMNNALKESGILQHYENILGCITEAGSATALQHIQNIQTDRQTLLCRSAYIDRLQHALHDKPAVADNIKAALQKAAAAEKILSTIDLSGSSSDLEKEATAQIYFNGTITKPLNSIPYIVMTLAALKIYVAPLLALCLPLIMFVMPYIFLTTLMKTDIPWETYKSILFRFVLGIDASEPWSLKQVMKLVWGLASFGQGILQPVFTAFHTWKLRATFKGQADAIREYTEATAELSRLYRSIVPCREPYMPSLPSDPYVAIHWWSNEITVVEHYRCLVGWYDMMYALGSNRRWKPVAWTSASVSVSVSTMKGVYDVSIAESTAVKNDVSLDGHTLITGPNRGGKSSVMRGVLQAIICAQTYGAVSNADQITMTTPYSALYTRLVSADRPGASSLFESDVIFALDVLRGCNSEPHPLVMIDELFHSTNPSDAETSAAYFLQQLWKNTGRASSLISTHMFGLLDIAPDHVGRLCVYATMEQDGAIKYTYSVRRGICKLSSVSEVWSSFISSANSERVSNVSEKESR